MHNMRHSLSNILPKDVKILFQYQGSTSGGNAISFSLNNRLGAVAVMLIEQWTGSNTCDFRTAAASSIACLFNIGPGLGLVGATANYERMTTGSKLLLTLMMALGRLEVFAIIVLLSPRFWRAN